MDFPISVMTFEGRLHGMTTKTQLVSFKVEFSEGFMKLKAYRNVCANHSERAIHMHLSRVGFLSLNCKCYSTPNLRKTYRLSAPPYPIKYICGIKHFN